MNDLSNQLVYREIYDKTIIGEMMEFEEYFDNDELMKSIRLTVLSIFPMAQERISYGMPAWFDGKNVLLYVKPHIEHLGLYPKPAFIVAHLQQLNRHYQCSKGTIKVPYNVNIVELEQLVKEIIEWNLTTLE